MHKHQLALKFSNYNPVHNAYFVCLRIAYPRCGALGELAVAVYTKTWRYQPNNPHQQMPTKSLQNTYFVCLRIACLRCGAVGILAVAVDAKTDRYHTAEASLTPISDGWTTLYLTK